MATKMMSKADFARLAGVTASTVTRVCKTSLAPAFDGKRIDVAHPAAVEYLAGRADGPTAPAPGIDPRYAEAVELCNDVGRCTVSTIARGLGMGQARAKRIHAMIESTGAFVEPTPETVYKPPKVSKAKPRTSAKSRGQDAARAGDTLPEVSDSNEHLAGFIDMTLRQILAQFGTDTRFLDWLNSLHKIEAILEKRIKNAQATGELVKRELVKRGVIEPIDTMLTKMLSDGARTISVRARALVESGADDAEVQALVEDILSSFIKPAKLSIARALRESPEAAAT